jgi:hypothetical protein
MVWHGEDIIDNRLQLETASAVGEHRYLHLTWVFHPGQRAPGSLPRTSFWHGAAESLFAIDLPL